MKSFTTFLIVSDEFNWRIGGRYALHMLAKLLAERGYSVYCVCNKTLPQSKARPITISQAVKIAQDSDTITIYPEIIVGNPLKARHPVRWVLYYPGGHGGETQYSNSECIVTYHDIFVKDTPYEGCELVHVRDSKTDTFFNLNRERNKNAILVKKGNTVAQSIEERYEKYLQPYSVMLGLENVLFIDDLIEQIPDMATLNEFFNQFKYFLSFDAETYHSVLAAMSGCISVIIPHKDLTKAKLFSELPDWKYGIAYGLDDIEHAQATRHLIHDYAKTLETENEASIDRLEMAIQNKFFNVK